METLLGLVSLSRILALPWYLGIVGLVLIAALLWSAIKSVLTLSPLKAVSRLVTAFVIAVVLSQWGETLVQMFATRPPSS